MPAVLGAMPAAVGYAPERNGDRGGHDGRSGRRRGHDRQRDAFHEWRKWYKTARWQALRLRVFERDGYVCQQTDELLTGRHPEPNSPVADHIRPHRGDADLFWDIDNIQTVSKAYHDKQKQSLERQRG